MGDVTHTWTRHVTYVDESCPTWRWVMSHTGGKPITKREGGTSHIWMRRVTHSYKGVLMPPVCDMTHSCVRHDSLKCVTWLILFEGRVTHTYKGVLSHTGGNTSTQREWVMSHTSLSHVTHMNESCRTQVATLVLKENESCHTLYWVMSHTWMSHVAHRWQP